MSSIDEMIYITDISAEKEMNDKVDSGWLYKTVS